MNEKEVTNNFSRFFSLLPDLLNDHKHGVVLTPAVVCLPAELPCGRHTYRLEELAYTRSGDKGDSANIGKTHRKSTGPDSTGHTLFP